jgi:predicted esterase YcpF (UPF0227 family)
MFSDIGVLAPDIPHDPIKAIPFLEAFIEPHHDGDLMLIGSSLDGYYAQYLARKFPYNVVLINPALNPVPLLLGQVGEQTNYYTGEKYMLTEESVRALVQYDVTHLARDSIPTLVLLDKGDELIDHRDAKQRYENAGKVVVFPGGSHRFNHLQESEELIRRSYYTIFI